MAGGHMAGGVFGVAGLVVKKEIGREFAQKTAFGQVAEDEILRRGHLRVLRGQKDDA